MNEENVRVGNEAVAGLQRESASLRAAAELKSSAAADLKAASEAQQAVAEASASLVEQVSSGVESLDDVKRRLKAFQERVALESDDLYRAVEEQQKKISELQALIVSGVSEKLSPRMRDMLQARAEPKAEDLEKDAKKGLGVAAPAPDAHEPEPEREREPKVPAAPAMTKEELLGSISFEELLGEVAKRQGSQARDEEPATEEAKEPDAAYKEPPAAPEAETAPVEPEAAPAAPAEDLDGLGDLDEPEEPAAPDPEVTTVITPEDRASARDAGATAPMADEAGEFGPAPLSAGSGTWRQSGGFGGSAFRADWAEEAGSADTPADANVEGGIEHVDRSDLKPNVIKQLDARGY